MHEQNCKCMNKIVKKEVLVVCTGFPLITTCRKNTLYFHFLPNWASQQSPRRGGEGMQWSSEGEVLSPAPHTLSLPNCSQQQLYNRPLGPVTKS